MIPMDLPAGPDYVVGPGDGLAIDLWGGVARKLYRTVDPKGESAFPKWVHCSLAARASQRSSRTCSRWRARNSEMNRLMFHWRACARSEFTKLATWLIPVPMTSVHFPLRLNALFVAGGPTPAGFAQDRKTLSQQPIG